MNALAERAELLCLFENEDFVALETGLDRAGKSADTSADDDDLRKQRWSAGYGGV